MLFTDFLQATLQPSQAVSYPKEMTLNNGVKCQWLERGILQFIPKQHHSNYDLIISVGVHGNETAPIELVNNLVQKIITNQLAVAVPLLIIFANPLAMVQQKRFVDENLNRLFSGGYKKPLVDNSVEAKRAQLIEQVVESFIQHNNQDQHYHYDLHTAIRGSQHEKFAVYPYLHDRSASIEQIKFLAASAIEAVLFSNSPSGTFSYYTSHAFNADSFTVELGQVKPWGENDLTRLSALNDNLQFLIRAEPARYAESLSTIKQYAVKAEIIKRTQQFKLLIADDIKNFTAFSAGTQLTNDENYSYTTTEEERIVFPNRKIEVGQRAGLLVVPRK